MLRRRPGFQCTQSGYAETSVTDRTVRVSVMSHWTHPYVMSSSVLHAASPSAGRGVTALTTMRFPQRGQGRRKLGRWEGIMFLSDTGAFPFPPAPSGRYFPAV
jgi:hypothetical protein